MSTTTSTLELGTKVTFRHGDSLNRIWVEGPDRGYDRKTWRKRDGDQRTASKGIVVGRRALSNGQIHYLGDEGISYKATEHFTAYLVAYALHRAPVFVLREDLTVHDFVNLRDVFEIAQTEQFDFTETEATR